MRVPAWGVAILFAVLSASVALADDFASDLAACAKAPIDATQFAFEDGKTAAQFAIDHGDCVPKVVGGDPVLYGLSGLVAAMQSHGDLPHGAQACIDASIGQSSKPVAGALDTILDSTGLGSLLPGSGRSMLKDIAAGKSDETLYDVPGISVVMQDVSCSCAVASSGLDAAKLKERLTSVVKAVKGCSGVAAKLVNGAYDAGKAAANAAGGAAKAAYEAAKDAVNSVGCTLGLGGCDKKGPPFFCVGYNNMRGQGFTAAQIAETFNGFPFTAMGGFAGAALDSDFQAQIAKQISDQLNGCEQQWANAIAAAAKKKADEEEAKRLESERDKAEKLGSAYALGFAFRWSPLCKDDQCRKGIAVMADQYNAEIKDPSTIGSGGYGSFGAAKAALETKYDARAKLAVALSQDRADAALRADANAPPEARLPAFGCRPFLGRAKQSLCTSTPGFQACKAYATRDLWDMCAKSGGNSGFYAFGPGLERVLRQAGCIPGIDVQAGRGNGVLNRRASPNLHAQCLSTHARTVCDALRRGQSTVDCIGPVLLVLNRPVGLRPDRVRPPSAIPPLRPMAPPVAPVPPLRPVSPLVEPPGIVRPPVVRFPRPAAVQKSTLCQFTAGPRAGERQDYAPMEPLPVGTPCHDGRGSTGVVIAP